MEISGLLSRFSDLRRCSGVDTCASANRRKRENLWTSSSRACARARVGASRLTRARFSQRSARSGCTLAAQGKAPQTVRTYPETVQWFAAAP